MPPLHCPRVNAVSSWKPGMKVIEGSSDARKGEGVAYKNNQSNTNSLAAVKEPVRNIRGVSPRRFAPTHGVITPPVVAVTPRPTMTPSALPTPNSEPRASRRSCTPKPPPSATRMLLPGKRQAPGRESPLAVVEIVRQSPRVERAASATPARREGSASTWGVDTPGRLLQERRHVERAPSTTSTPLAPPRISALGRSVAVGELPQRKHVAVIGAVMPHRAEPKVNASYRVTPPWGTQ